MKTEDVRILRAGDHVKVVKKIMRKDLKDLGDNSEWYQEWTEKLDGMLDLVCRVVEVNWNGYDYMRPNDRQAGHGIYLTDPRSQRVAAGFYFHPLSLELALHTPLSIIYDKDGYCMQPAAANGLYKFCHQKTGYSTTFYFDPHCCGVAYMGSFNTYKDVGETLLRKAIEFATENKKGVIKATVTASQYQQVKLLEKVGFKCRSAFRNPNSGNIVYEYEHRTGHGNIEKDASYPHLDH